MMALYLHAGYPHIVHLQWEKAGLPAVRRAVLAQLPDETQSGLLGAAHRQTVGGSLMLSPLFIV